MSTYLNLKPVDFDKLSTKRQAAVTWPGRILLPKYDGCLALVFFRYGKLLAIMSRDGKLVKSMDHIAEDLLLRYPMLAETKAVCIIGEAWSPGKEFADLSGTFRRQSPQRHLGFAPFDVVQFSWEMPGVPQLFSGRSYRDRLSLLEDARQIACLVFPPLPVICESKEHAERYAQNLKDMGGYDGAVASDPDAIYEVSDGKGEFLKIKPLLSYTLECTGYEASVGEKTGRPTVALVVRFKGGTCKVGTGLSEAEQANPEQFVGKLIEVECMGVYPGDGKMREPRFKGVRNDVTVADY